MDLEIDKKNLSLKFRDVKTYSGFEFDLAKSALQKYIRRGMLKKALYLACELDMFRIIPECKAQFTNFYNRLRIILLEDIGLANPEGVLEIAKSLSLYREEKTQKTSLLISDIINKMCKSPHCRFYSHVRNYTKKLDIEKGSFLEFLKDKKIECWYFAEKMDPKDVFSQLEKVQNSDTLKMCKEWYKTLKVKENFLCLIHPIFVSIMQTQKFNPPKSLRNIEKYYQYLI